MHNNPKCEIEDGKFVIPCDPLLSLLEDNSPLGAGTKGVFRWELHNTRTGDRSRTIIGAKSGDHTKNGLIFNYCPICGTKIDATVKNK